MTTLEERVKELELQVKGLNTSFLQYKKNQNTFVEKTDENNYRINALTPYVETKVGYYGEKIKTFYEVPMGNITVQFDNYNGSYSVGRIADRVTVSFDALTEPTNITISVK